MSRSGPCHVVTWHHGNGNGRRRGRTSGLQDRLCRPSYRRHQDWRLVRILLTALITAAALVPFAASARTPSPPPPTSETDTTSARPAMRDRWFFGGGVGLGDLLRLFDPCLFRYANHRAESGVPVAVPATRTRYSLPTRCAKTGQLVEAAGIEPASEPRSADHEWPVGSRSTPPTQLVGGTARELIEKAKILFEIQRPDCPRSSQSIGIFRSGGQILHKIEPVRSSV